MFGSRERSRSPIQTLKSKKAIEHAYRLGKAAGVSVWCEDEAGPYQTKPYAATSWQPEGQPQRQPHEYVRNGTAHIITLFYPASGQVHLTGVLHTTNVILHCWLEQELTTILAQLTEPAPCAEPTKVRAS